MDGSSGRVLEADGFDPCAVAGDQAYGGDGGGDGGGGEIVRALDLLPQRMADLEELATAAHGLDDGVRATISVPGRGKSLSITFLNVYRIVLVWSCTRCQWK